MGSETERSIQGGLGGGLAGRSVASRLLRLVAVAVLCIVAAAAYQLNAYRDGLWSQRSHELVSLSAVAASIVNSEYQAALAGRQTMTAAQLMANQRLATLRYNEGDYFFINDMLPRMVMHPIKPELDGRDLRSFTDPTGKRLFVEMVSKRRPEKATDS